MAQQQDDVALDDTVVVDEDDKKDKSGNVADYLQAPRRKRKSFVLMALGRGTADFASGIEAFVRTNYKTIAVSQPRSAEELVKNFARQIVLVVFDDEFVDLTQGLELVKEMKRRKNTSGVPVLFLTRQPERLVENYNRMLLPFQETDEYLLYPKADISHVVSKIRQGLVGSYRRRSRRYKVDIPLQYFLLADDKLHPGRLTDLSVHGGLLKAEDDRIYRLGEQLKLHLPVAEYLPINQGDYLKLSAKVRRVFIGGTQAGISFEHMSEHQLYSVTQFLTEMVNDQASKKAVTAKSRSSR